MVTSFVAFWATVVAYAADDDARRQNTLLLAASVALILAVAGLWSASARPTLWGAAVGALAGVGLAVVLAVGFGAVG